MTLEFFGFPSSSISSHYISAVKSIHYGGTRTSNLPLNKYGIIYEARYWETYLRGGIRNSCWHSTHMRDRSHFLITHDCGRALNIDACQKTKQSDNIWRNDNGPNKESPVLPYKNDWEGRGDFQSFLYGTTGDSPLTHGAFRQMWSDLISFRDPSIFNPLPQLCITRIWLRSLIIYELNAGKNSIPPPSVTNLSI